MPAKPDHTPLLEGVLSNTQIPHQPLVIVDDDETFGGVPIFRDMIRRSSADALDTLVSALRSPDIFLPSPSSSGSASSSSSSAAAGPSTMRNKGVTRVVDLTTSTSIPGFGSEGGIADIESRILSDYSGGQIFLDSLDIIAEDYGSASTMKMVRHILDMVRKAKAPSRLVLLLSPASPLHPTLTSATFSPTVTHLVAHPPALVSHLSRQYLSPISTNPSPNLWMILVNATKRHLAADLAFRAEEGIEYDPEWDWAGAGIVRVLVRKATGGTKGISRSLEGLGLGLALSSSISHKEKEKERERTLRIVPLDTLVPLNPLTTPSTTDVPARAAATHAELDLPFNLSLTDAQRRQRGAVPLPYAHEGEGASGDLIWEDEEETDDEEI